MSKETSFGGNLYNFIDDFTHIRHPPPHDRADWVLIKVDILKVATGQHAISSMEGCFDAEKGDLSTYIWEEGDFSCDCNRANFFTQAMELGASEADAGEDDTCSVGRFVVQVRSAKTGRVIFTDALWTPALVCTPENA